MILEEHHKTVNKKYQKVNGQSCKQIKKKLKIKKINKPNNFDKLAMKHNLKFTHSLWKHAKISTVVQQC